MIEILLENGVSVDQTTKDGRVLTNSDAIAKWFMSRSFLLGVPFHHTIKNGRTALHFAAEYKKGADIIKYLLGKEISPDVEDNDGRAPIHYAAYRGLLGNIKILVEAGADIKRKASDGRTVLHFAVDGRELGTIEYLINEGFSVDDAIEDGQTPLHICASSGSFEILEWLVAKGGDIARKTKDDRTIVHSAAGNSSRDGFKMLNYLLKQGLQFEAKTKEGLTPLHFCGHRGSLDNMLLLSRKGASIRASANDGRTILHSAALNGNGLSMIQFLVRSGLPIDSRTTKGQTPLHFSCKAGSLENSRFFVE